MYDAAGGKVRMCWWFSLALDLNVLAFFLECVRCNVFTLVSAIDWSLW